MTFTFEKILFVIFFVFLIFIGFLVYDFKSTQDERIEVSQEAVQDENVITINVVTENLYPLSYVDESSGSVKGVATEIIRRVLDHTGYDYNIEIHSWSEAYGQAVSEENTIIFSMARIPSRESKFFWLHKITELNYGLYTPNINLTSLSTEAVKDLYITVTKNDLSHYLLRDMGFSNFIFIKDNERITDLLAKDQIDIMLGSDLWILQNQASLPAPLYLLENVNFEAARKSMYFAINVNTSPAVVFRIRKSFNSVIDENTFSDLLAKYNQ